MWRWGLLPKPLGFVCIGRLHFTECVSVKFNRREYAQMMFLLMILFYPLEMVFIYVENKFDSHPPEKESNDVDYEDV